LNGDRGKRIPRRIWILWFQGIINAPHIVKKCVGSWVKLNPGWEVIILDNSNVSKYVDLDIPENVIDRISLAHRSDLVRIQLLSKYGGVWADATTLCVKPLDEWIDDYSISGFFSFYKPGPDRIMSNWFMSCEKDCPIAVKLNRQLTSFWRNNKFDVNSKFKQAAIAILSRILNRNERTTKYWFSAFTVNILRVYPYYLFHYMFERLVNLDPESRAVWNKTKKVSADAPHLILKTGLFSPLTPDVKQKIQAADAPVYKLTWKYDHERYSPGTLLYYVLEGP